MVIASLVFPVVPADWFSNAESLRESFRIANSLDWANIDLTNHPGQFFSSVIRGGKKPAASTYCFALHLRRVTHTFFWISDLVESMRQAELCDWALDPALFTSLCDSLNRFFTRRGIIGSQSGGPSSPSPLASPIASMQLAAHPTLSHLTQPSPLSLPPQLLHCSGAPPIPSHRKTLAPQSHSQNSQRNLETQPAASQPLASTGKSRNRARGSVASS